MRVNLPQEPNSFVGRERELGELRRLVAQTRALTISGPGGIGKTRLALRLLASLVGSCPDGVCFVELGDLRQPDLVVSRVASAVGVGEEPGRPLLDTLTDAVRRRRMILALDNCEHLVGACAWLCQRLLAAAPFLRLVVTSREPLRVAGETVWQAPPLALPPAAGATAPEDALACEAIRLFADRSAAAAPRFAVSLENVQAVAGICRALDGVPLAIELAAARVRVLSVEQVRARLADRFALLTMGDRTAPLRHRTLRAAIDWSFDLLSAQERVLLRRLSVFAGWSLEMAEQVCADEKLPAAQMLDLIAALVDKSLVVVEPEALNEARYRLLETIRDYAADRLAETGEAEVFRRRLREYTLSVAERSHAIGMARVPAPWRERVDVFRRYDVDLGNLNQVLAACLADGDAQAGLRISACVCPCWIVRGVFAEGREWVESFLALAGPSAADCVKGAALVGSAQLALPSDPATAWDRACAGLELCRAAGDAYWTAAALNLLAETATHTGRPEEASPLADEALAVAQAAGDGWHEGYALGTQATLAALAGKLREARQLATSSLEVMRRVDQQWGAARALLGLGDLARLRGDPGEAHGRYLEALAILRQVDGRPEIARCLAGLGRVAMDLGAPDLARLHLTESIRLSQGTGARLGMARGLAAFAALAAVEDRPELAVRLTAAATALREAAGLPPLHGARVERYLAPASRHLGEPAVARLWAQGLTMSADSAVALAVDGSPHTAGDRPAALRLVADYHAAASPPSALTPRERQVAALVAGGLSNKAIAEELVISPATAARHVANILAKLGFSSRAQVAAWAADHGGLAAQDLAIPPARKA